MHLPRAITSVTALALRSHQCWRSSGPRFSTCAAAHTVGTEASRNGSRLRVSALRRPLLIFARAWSMMWPTCKAEIQMRVPAGRPIIATTRESAAAVYLATPRHGCAGIPAQTQSLRHSRAIPLHWTPPAGLSRRPQPFTGNNGLVLQSDADCMSRQPRQTICTLKILPPPPEQKVGVDVVLASDQRY